MYYSIKATARTITKTKLSDRIHSEDILKRANPRCLNESVGSIIATTVWQSKQSKNQIGQCLFSERTNQKSTRSSKSAEIRPPVPGYPNLALNIMARVWNDIPELHNAKTLGAAKKISRNWAKRLPR